MAKDLMTPQDEFDFSQDTTVETIEGVWTITEAEQEHVESEKGTGTRVVVTLQGEALPFPITVRQFTEYQYKNGGDNSWVKRSRGALKNLFKAATGEVKGSLEQLVGSQVRATTKDDGNGFYTLFKFRNVA